MSAVEAYKNYFNQYYSEYRKFRQAITRRYIQDIDYYKLETKGGHKHEYMVKSEVIESLKVIAKQLKKGKKDKNTGVYIIQYPWGIKKIKIGWSDNVFSRYKQYNTTFCGQQKLLFHLQVLDNKTEDDVFNLAVSIGMIRNNPYEVFDYENDDQITKLIDILKDKYGTDDQE